MAAPKASAQSRSKKSTNSTSSGGKKSTTSAQSLSLDEGNANSQKQPTALGPDQLIDTYLPEWKNAETPSENPAPPARKPSGGFNKSSSLPAEPFHKSFWKKFAWPTIFHDADDVAWVYKPARSVLPAVYRASPSDASPVLALGSGEPSATGDAGSVVDDEMSIASDMECDTSDRLSSTLRNVKLCTTIPPCSRDSADTLATLTYDIINGIYIACAVMKRSDANWHPSALIEPCTTPVTAEEATGAEDASLPAAWYRVRLYVFGKWREVLVDDSIPCFSFLENTSSTLFPVSAWYTSSAMETWPLILSKALLGVALCTGLDLQRSALLLPSFVSWLTSNTPRFFSCHRSALKWMSTAPDASNSVLLANQRPGSAVVESSDWVCISSAPSFQGIEDGSSSRVDVHQVSYLSCSSQMYSLKAARSLHFDWSNTSLWTASFESSTGFAVEDRCMQSYPKLFNAAQRFCPSLGRGNAPTPIKVDYLDGFVTKADASRHFSCFVGFSPSSSSSDSSFNTVRLTQSTSLAGSDGPVAVPLPWALRTSSADEHSVIPVQLRVSALSVSQRCRSCFSEKEQGGGNSDANAGLGDGDSDAGAGEEHMRVAAVSYSHPTCGTTVFDDAMDCDFSEICPFAVKSNRAVSRCHVFPGVSGIYETSIPVNAETLLTMDIKPRMQTLVVDVLVPQSVSIQASSARDALKDSVSLMDRNVGVVEIPSVAVEEAPKSPILFGLHEVGIPSKSKHVVYFSTPAGADMTGYQMKVAFPQDSGTTAVETMCSGLRATICNSGDANQTVYVYCVGQAAGSCAEGSSQLTMKCTSSGSGTPTFSAIPIVSHERVSGVYQSHAEYLVCNQIVTNTGKEAGLLFVLGEMEGIGSSDIRLKVACDADADGASVSETVGKRWVGLCCQRLPGAEKPAGGKGAHGAAGGHNGGLAAHQRHCQLSLSTVDSSSCTAVDADGRPQPEGAPYLLYIACTVPLKCEADGVRENGWEASKAEWEKGHPGWIENGTKTRARLYGASVIPDAGDADETNGKKGSDRPNSRPGTGPKKIGKASRGVSKSKVGASSGGGTALSTDGLRLFDYSVIGDETVEIQKSTGEPTTKALSEIDDGCEKQRELAAAADKQWREAIQHRDVYRMEVDQGDDILLQDLSSFRKDVLSRRDTDVLSSREQYRQGIRALFDERTARVAALQGGKKKGAAKSSARRR